MARAHAFRSVPTQIVPVVAATACLAVFSLVTFGAYTIVSNFEQTGAVKNATSNISSEQSRIRVVPGTNVAPEGVSDELQGAASLQSNHSTIQQPTTSNTLQPNAQTNGFNSAQNTP